MTRSAMVAKPILCPALFLTATLLLCVYVYSPNLLTETARDKIIITKYILLWTDPNLAPLNFLSHGFDAFLANDCDYTNCYVTHNMSVLPSVTDYDAIVFNGRTLPTELPKERSVRQKYVYANMESSHNYPACDERFEGFFNWTWTYRLDSDSRWGYITVYNLSGRVVGPKKDMSWLKLDPIDSGMKKLLASKRKAAAWFVSNCKSKSRREEIAEAVAKELYQFGLTLDIFGRCGKSVCPRRDASLCNKKLAKSYYFYFAFENSFSEDYVTEKVLTALQHRTVPVVFGAANYSRFLPPGSYLDAQELDPKRLGRRMAEIIDNHKNGDGKLYHDFFRWWSHYTFRETSEKEDVCKICQLLNDPVSVSKVTVYDHFKQWWNSESSKCPGDV